MKRPDYEAIAATYDGLAVRREIGADAALRGLVEGAGERRLTVLDVGCGTGNWLVAQVAAFGERIAPAGNDPSSAMLARARAKLPGVPLLRGRAERLPFADASADFVGARFAYHHFEDKEAALDELVRVLAPGGTLQLVNIAPEKMLGWWVLRWFPQAQAFSDARFWAIERLVAALEARGLVAMVALDRREERLAAADVLEQATRRDQSHLASLDDAEWTAGLARLTRDLAGAGDVVSEMTVVHVTARGR